MAIANRALCLYMAEQCVFTDRLRGQSAILNIIIQTHNRVCIKMLFLLTTQNIFEATNIFVKKHKRYSKKNK